MRQVARLAGVGLKSVSRVINDEPNVSAELRARVETAIASLDYQPNLQAGSLRGSGGSRSLGLVVSSVANPFASVLHRGVEDAAARQGVAVFAASGDDNPDREKEIVAALVRRRVDGLIITSTGTEHGYLLKHAERGVPIVFVDRAPVGIDSDSVVSDNVCGAAVAVQHLIDHGHRRIAYLGDLRDIRTAADRRAGYIDAMGRNGIPLSEVIAVEDLHDEQVADDAVMRLLLDPPATPTALFTSQNLITVGAIRALQRLGKGHEVALVGFDDFPLADLLDPAITVIAQDPHRIGELATERIFARQRGEADEPEAFVVPTRLIVRGSGEIAGPYAGRRVTDTGRRV